MTTLRRSSILSLLALALALPVGAQGFSDAVRAYAWANLSSSDSYTPSSSYSYNASGGAITATRSGEGSYAIQFEGLGAEAIGGHVQVTAYDSNAYCAVKSWGPTGDALGIIVECRNPAGALVDSRYDVLFVSSASEAVPGLAYVWANNPTAPAYTPSTSYSYNGSEAVAIVRTDVGRYAVTFLGLSTNQGHVQVSAYSDDVRCHLGGSIAEAVGLVVEVRCYDADGNPADGRYTVMRLGMESVSPELGFALASNSGEASYTPNDRYRYNGSSGAVSATRNGVGDYRMTFAGLASTEGGHVQVTSSSSTNKYCNVEEWFASGDDIAVDVGCYDAAGVRADAFYNVLFTSPAVVTTPNEAGAEPAATFALDPAAPNPFAGQTRFGYEIAEAGSVRLTVFDLLGREVAVLVDRERGPGRYEATLEGIGLPSGVYIARLESGSRTAARRVTLVR